MDSYEDVIRNEYNAHVRARNSWRKIADGHARCPRWLRWLLYPGGMGQAAHEAAEMHQSVVARLERRYPHAIEQER